MNERTKIRTSQKPALLKRIAKEVFTYIIIGILCIIILEIFVRIFIPQSSVQFDSDYQVGWLHQKNITIRHVTSEFDYTYRTNSEGFIDTHDYNYTKPKNTFRILVLGDSFVEAEEVAFNESFVQLLKQKLNDPKNNPKNITFELMNTGASGYGTKQEYLLLKNYGLNYSPDLVMMVMFTGNDIRNNYFDTSTNQIVMGINSTGDLYTIANNVVPYSTLNLFVGKHSQLAYLFIYTIYPKIRDLFTHEEDCPLDYISYVQNYSEEWNSAINLTEKIVSESNRISLQNRANFVLVTLPSKYQINQSLLGPLKEAYPCLQNQTFEVEKPNRIMEQYCAENNLLCANMLDPFERQFNATQAQLFYPIDGHLNKAGNAFLADQLYNYLVDRKLIPS